MLAAILLLVHLGGMVLVAVIPIAWAIRLGLWTLLGWSLYRSLRTHALRVGPEAIAAVELDGEGAVAVRLGGHADWRPCQVTARFIHPWLTLLRLRIDGRWMPVNLVIAADAVEPEPFRRWRASLKLQTAAA